MRPGLSAPLLPQTSASRGRGSSIAPRFWPLVIFGPSLVHRWSSPSAHGPRLWASDIILGLVHVSQVAGNLRAIRLAGCVAACYNKWITKQNVIVSTKKKISHKFHTISHRVTSNFIDGLVDWRLHCLGSLRTGRSRWRLRNFHWSLGCVPKIVKIVDTPL